MTFYNPIVPPFMPSFFSNKYYNKKSLPQEIKNENYNDSFSKSDINIDSSSNTRESSKNEKKVFLNNYLLDNIFSEIQESDTLILLCLIYLLYIQGNNDIIIYILLLIGKFLVNIWTEF